MSMQANQRVNIDKEVNDRFIIAMNLIIHFNSKKKHGSIKWFCEKIEIHQPKISQIENYFTSPTIHDIVKMGKVFGISPTWILLGISPQLLPKK